MSASLTYLNPENAPPAQGLYSHATRVSGGTTYFIAGQLAVGDDGEVVGKNDFEAQCRRVFHNMGTVLAALGLSFKNIAKFNTFLVHSQDLATFMRLRAEIFPGLFGDTVFPPNTLLVVDRMVKEDFLFEVEAIAHSAD